MEEIFWQALNIFAMAVLLLTIGCKISPKCLYYTKVSIIYIGLLNMGNMLSIYGLFHKSYQTSRFAKVVLDPIGKLLNIQFTVKGQERINKNRAYIVVVNHQHALDVISVMQVSSNRLRTNVTLENT